MRSWRPEPTPARPAPPAAPWPGWAGAAPPQPPAADAEAVLRQLEWTVIRRLDGLLHGDYRSLMRGAGLDLADLREYQPADDVRHIDWNVTARLGQPHVRVFHEDHEMSAWFLLDLSPSVDFGSGTQRKRQVSARFVAVLARLLTRHGNRIGALLYGSQVGATLPARGGRRHVLQLLHAMQAGAEDERARPTRLAELLHAAAGIVHARSTLFVVSDFISEPGWERPLAQLAQRHDVVAVRLLDPLEMALPDLGLVTLRDAETGELLMVDTHDEAFRERFAHLAAQRQARLRQTLAQAGVDALELSTDDDLVDTVIRFAELRRQRLHGAGAGLPRHLRHPA